MKPWLREELEQQIRAGEIRAYFSSELIEIGEETITIRTAQGRVIRPNSFVMAMTGYRPDMNFLRKCGIEIDPFSGRPAIDSETLETNRPGVYLAGVVVSGLNTHELNISHARDHAKRIAAAVGNHRRTESTQGQGVNLNHA
jgi:thioredoxin reductase (NADPH)